MAVLHSNGCLHKKKQYGHTHRRGHVTLGTEVGQILSFDRDPGEDIPAKPLFIAICHVCQESVENV